MTKNKQNNPPPKTQNKTKQNKEKTRNVIVAFTNPLKLNFTHFFLSPVGWSCRKNRLHLCSGVRSSSDECPRYGIKQSDGEVPVILKL